MVTLVDEKDWGDYVIFLLQNALTSLPTERAEETKHAVLDISGWLHAAHQGVTGVVMELVKTARTPRDRERIDALLKAVALIDLAETHVDYIADGPQGLRVSVPDSANVKEKH